MGCGAKGGQSPVGAKEKVREDWCILSSLTGLVPYSCHTPAMNRWAGLLSVIPAGLLGIVRWQVLGTETLDLEL